MSKNTASIVFTGVASGLGLAYARGDFDRPGIGWPELSDLIFFAVMIGGLFLATHLLVRLSYRLWPRSTDREF